jgi:hypothetical protein
MTRGENGETASPPHDVALGNWKQGDYRVIAVPANGFQVGRKLSC